MESKAYLIALADLPGLGNSSLLRLLEHFQDPKTIWNLPLTAWEEIGIRPSAIKSWQEARNQDPLKEAEVILKNIKLTAITDSDYPSRLAQINDPPAVIFYQGDLGCLKQRILAVVGSRKITSYGQQVTKFLVDQLSIVGVTIVSGLAQGVDTLAHKTTIANGGLTAAVLGSGLWQIFPAENEGLVQEIIKSGGIVLSEYHPLRPAIAGQFPARNRIIAGLSEAVLVTEAAAGSGSLITAREALDQGKEVFAVPGPITSYASSGTSILIKQGATLVSRPEDILDPMEIYPQTSANPTLKLSKQEQDLVQALQTEQKHFDELIRLFSISTADLAAMLLKLELNGVIDNLSPGMYIATMKI